MINRLQSIIIFGLLILVAVNANSEDKFNIIKKNINSAAVVYLELLITVESIVFDDIDSLPGQNYQARLTRLGAHADPLTRKVPVEFEVIGNFNSLKIGAFVRLELPLNKKQSLLIPDSALLKKGEQDYVFVIQSGTAYEVALEVGRRHADQLEVLSGVYAGNQVVVSGLEGLASGDLIEILNSPT